MSRSNDTAHLLTNSDQDDHDEEASSGNSSRSNPQVLVDLGQPLSHGGRHLSDSNNGIRSSHHSGLLSASQHTANTASLQREPSYLNQVSVTTGSTIEYEHSNATEDDSYSSVDETKVMLKPGAEDSEALISSPEDDVLLHNGEPRPQKRRGSSMRQRFDSASSRLTKNSIVSVLGENMEERTGETVKTARMELGGGVQDLI